MFDYEVLRFIWWALIGVLLIGFTVTDGFDLGVGILLPIIGKDDTDRRIMINTIAPHWDGNQVWLITAGGALFAAWPMVYAVAFSGFYVAMMLVLFALFLRPVGFDYRSKIEDPKWRKTWDKALFVGCFVPPLIIGVAFGNLLQGVPFNFDEYLRATYHGGLFGLLNPFGLLAGLVSVTMVIMQGSTWLQMKTDGELRVRSAKTSQICGSLLVVLFGAAGFWLVNGIDGYVITSALDVAGVSNPTTKTVAVEAGGWLINYDKYPLTMLFPVLGLLMPVLVVLASRLNRSGFAFFFSSLAVAGVILTCGAAMFPFVMPSSLEPNVSLTMWDATASQMSLKVMTVAAIIFVPTVLSYTIWTYYKMFGRLNREFIENNKNSLY
ncbi:cytochrome d ubiquinol oxidase subunit II [Shewanella vesiculosa]|jgi:cytochrome d ubiquinol oxidase subunit II|uniref:Cytochrome d ubiquinol oxidase subunit II n=1 Tax=Shewanella vesiculosa TaxID=518738 RepID=A0ABV0FJH6_9GAMM|nr:MULTISPECIES: cytochrome d ubiquinol oxidase subunit II [Shewanella]MBB1320199.1 cytochrome d ubiquinol oxidase subunit II [Shewanella sp. SR43-8]MBB1391813.1 cytochrome d ubiquinol oxidase subunit II [Shewanella sp. SG44-6]RPA50711.1 cytochrome d ubiquinol oxidase subunit II [Shewanella vesiculosa]UJL44294.1 cytochrome d ubiquinol oxidase subunit II [Shewanella vesiculosa]|tara:strand:+ start:1930 stop:3069 length:1140 start_codon:yes stop_codon:yes gene_type:complete